MRQKILEIVEKIAEKNKKIIFIGSDLGPNTLINFKKKFPERFFMEGAAEQHIIAMARGFAKEGFIPYINTISTCLTRRCYEQILLDMSFQNSKIRLIANGGGLVYAPLGNTHLATDDIGLMRLIPNMAVLAPADEIEMEKMVKKTVNYPYPIFFRVAKGNDPILTDKIYKNFKLGNFYKYGHGDILIFTTGITLGIGLKVRDLLKALKIDSTVVHTPTLKPINTKQLKTFTDKAKYIFTIEEHKVIGGLGSIISQFVAENFSKKLKKFKIIGLPDAYLKGYGRQHEMMKRYNLDSKSCFNLIKKELKD